MSNVRSEYLAVARDRFGSTITRQQIKELELEGYAYPSWMTTPENRIGRGHYRLPEDGVIQNISVAVDNTKSTAPATPSAPPSLKKKISSVVGAADGVKIPGRDPLYVNFGFHKNLKAIISSGSFYPTFISGLSGNGKTMMVEQVCAQTNREWVRVNISPETCEDDLIGGFRLVNGETEWFDGPVISAMKKGAVLCLDEIDRGTNKLMCLQGVLEGKPVLIKKTGELVEPAKGFNIIATANTKGKGDDTGRFMAATILDDAFLERFPITVEQEYPSVSIEKRIMKNVFSSLGVDDIEFSEKLVNWADIIRRAYNDGAVDELISTRRLVHIANAYKIFGDRMTAIELCVNRFDDESKASFLDLYTKIDDEVSLAETSDDTSPESTENEAPLPF